jgi:hypothetical protein
MILKLIPKEKKNNKIKNLIITKEISRKKGH